MDETISQDSKVRYRHACPFVFAALEDGTRYLDGECRALRNLKVKRSGCR